MPPGFRPDQRIGLVMVGTPLRVTQDDRTGTGISQHLRRNIAGMGAGRFGMTILPPNDHRRAAGGRGKGRDQSCRRTDHQFGLAGERLCPGYDLGEFARRGGKPIHFPIARNERSDLGRRHRKIPSRERLPVPLWQCHRAGNEPILVQLQGVAPLTMVPPPRLG